MHEESIRVPLMVRYPERIAAGSGPSAMVSSLDLAPTILELAGVQLPETGQGRSLWPLLENEQVPWRDLLLYEYFQEYGPGVPTILGVRSERWRYITYPEIDDISELYDLAKDPLELRNLISVTTYRGCSRPCGVRSSSSSLRLATPPKWQRAGCYGLGVECWV